MQLPPRAHFTLPRMPRPRPQAQAQAQAHHLEAVVRNRRAQPRVGVVQQAHGGAQRQRGQLHHLVPQLVKGRLPQPLPELLQVPHLPAHLRAGREGGGGGGLERRPASGQQRAAAAPARPAELGALAALTGSPKAGRQAASQPPLTFQA
jgi:hypothetical protein